MRTTYKSKVEPVILIPLIIMFGLGIYFLVINGIWIGAGAAALIVIFLAYLYFSTFYELTSDQKLKIKIGFLYRKEIYIRSIKRIRKTKNHIASPALSGDRIEIQFNRYESVLISPSARAEFIDQLRKINPTIKMAEPSKV
jgi:hypothetical protein